MGLFDFLKKLFSEKSEKACCGMEHLDQSDIQTDLQLDEDDLSVLQTIDEKVVIGKILEITPHPDPNITRVRITKTEIAPGKTEQILCGGVNIEVGAIVPVATVGAKLGENFEVGEREIRGEVSRGMICSRPELKLSSADEPEGGIWILPQSYEKFIGQSLRDL